MKTYLPSCVSPPGVMCLGRTSLSNCRTSDLKIIGRLSLAWLDFLQNTKHGLSWWNEKNWNPRKSFTNKKKFSEKNCAHSDHTHKSSAYQKLYRLRKCANIVYRFMKSYVLNTSNFQTYWISCTKTIFKVS